MTVPINTASLLDIETEFGVSGTISLLDLYAGRGNVENPGPTSGYQTGPIPTSGQISIGDFLGVRRVVRPVYYTSPGTYYLTVPNGITSAAFRIAGGNGGGGGGGKAGGGDSTDTARGNGGSGGAGGGAGGAGQIIDSIVVFGPTPYLRIVVGDGGAGGAGGLYTTYDGTWRRGSAGIAGGDGQYTEIFDAAGNLLEYAGHGLGGSGGNGGNQDTRSLTPGGTGGAGYPGGQGGQYALDSFGYVGIVITYTSNPAAASNTYPVGNNLYGGPGGVGATSGGNGGNSQDGVGQSGSQAQAGYAYIQLNGTTSIGGGFVTTQATAGNPSVNPGYYNYVVYVDPNAGGN